MWKSNVSFLPKCPNKSHNLPILLFTLKLCQTRIRFQSGKICFDLFCGLFYPDGSRTRVAGMKIQLLSIVPPWLPFLQKEYDYIAYKHYFFLYPLSLSPISLADPFFVHNKIFLQGHGVVNIAPDSYHIELDNCSFLIGKGSQVFPWKLSSVWASCFLIYLTN